MFFTMKRAKGLLCVLLCACIVVTAAPRIFAEEAAVTRLEFYEIVMRFMEEKGTISHFGIGYEPFGDVSNPYVSEAFALGFVKGDGCGNFRPDDTMTREQAAVALKRVQDFIVPRLIYDNRNAKALGDREEIADYAVSSVALLTMTGTIGGRPLCAEGGRGQDVYPNRDRTHIQLCYISAGLTSRDAADEKNTCFNVSYDFSAAGDEREICLLIRRCAGV